MQACNLLRPYFLLNTADDALKSENPTFIQDKQHLESVIGHSQDSWFEALTVRQIQCQKSNSVKGRFSVVDSPTCSPALSQLIHGQLSVGPSPTGLRHSSPAPYCRHEESFNARLSLGTPQSDGWQRPLLDLSPGPSPIVQNKSALSHPSSSGVYSLGLDDSNLSWTNSLATPPRDQSQSDLPVRDTVTSPCRTKDTARALFSPGSTLDTTEDSVLPLDSTFEEDQSDVDCSKLEKTHSKLNQSNKTCNQSKRESLKTKSPQKVLLSQEVTTKADILKQSPVGIKHAENLKENFKKRLISRKDSLTENSKKFKSKNRNNCPVFNSSDTDKSVKKESYSQTVTDIDKSYDLEDYSLSPTFSQKSSRSKIKSCKSPSVSSRCKRSSIDDVLSDFFDPPAASVGRRKPAPSRKRKSLELEDSVNFDTQCSAEVTCDRSDTALDVSTPKGTLHSILASDKKEKVSSTKKVRFSDNVKKCTFIPEHSTSLQRKAEKKSLSKKKISTKTKSNDVLKSRSNSTNDSLRNDIPGSGNDFKLTNETGRKSPKKHQELKDKLMSENHVDPFKSNGDTLSNHSKYPDHNIETKTSMFVDSNQNNNRSNKSKNRQPKGGTRHKGETDNEMAVSAVRAVSGDNSEEELFSQVSPSALNEMCDVAEKHITSKYGKESVHENVRSGKDNSDSVEKQRKMKRFFYPSVSHIAGASASKVFQYNEQETKGFNKKVLLSSVKLEDVVDKDLDKSVDTPERPEEIKEHLPENLLKVVDKENPQQSSVMQQNMTHTVSDERSLSPTRSVKRTTKIVEKIPDIQFKSVCGFQSAAGRPVTIPKQALDKAATLLLEDSTENKVHKVPLLVCNTVDNAKHERSFQEDKHTEVPAKVQKFDINSQAHEIHTDNFCRRMHSPEGFQSASGKSLKIPTKALEKAASILGEDIPDSKSGLDFKSTIKSLKVEDTTNNTGTSTKLSTGLQSGIKTVISAPTPTLEKDSSLDKLGPNLTENSEENEGISVQGKATNICKGFQFASGKDILVAEQALEKAASLLQEENNIFTPNKNNQVENKTENVVDKQNKYIIEDALIEDIEFSEWYEEEMEPYEGFLLQPEVEANDLNNELSCNEISGEQKPNASKSNQQELCSGVLANSETEKEGNAKELIAIQSKEVENENSESPVCAPSGEVLKKDTEPSLNSKMANVNKPVIYDQSEQSLRGQNLKFMGFQTAGGRSLAFSEEKLKHAENILNDTDSKMSASLNVPSDFGVKKTLLNKLNSQTNIKCVNTTDIRERNSKLVDIQKGELGKGLSDAVGELDNSTVRANNVQELNECDVFSNEVYKSKETLNKNMGRASDGLSVAERLKLEFENALTVDKIHNDDSKSFENELKDLEDLKRNRKVQIEKQSSVLEPVEIPSLKQFPTKTNVPKGFRPFKPPKIARLSSHEKYPQSIIKDWGCTNEANADPVTSGSNKLNEADSIKLSVTKKHHDITDDLRKHYSNQNSAKKFHEDVTKISLKRTTNKNITYPESKLKHWVQDSDKKNCENNTDMELNDKVKSCSKMLTETDTSNSLKAESEHLDTYNKVYSDISNVNMVDLQGISQMFEDDMDFTQMKSEDINETLDEEEEIVKHKEFSPLEEHVFNLDVEHKHRNDKEIASKSDRDELNSDFTDTMSRTEMTFVGFSTASGKSVSISRTAMESAVKVLSKYDDEKSPQEGRQLDMNNDTDKTSMSSDIRINKVVSLQSSFTGHTCSSDDRNEKSNSENNIKMSVEETKEVAMADQPLSTVEITGNIRSEMYPQNCSHAKENSMKFLTENESLRFAAQVKPGREVTSASAEEVNVKSLDESKDVNLKISDGSSCETSESSVLYIPKQKQINEKPTASDTSIEISETALMEARKSVNNTMQKSTSGNGTCSDQSEDVLLHEKELKKQEKSSCIFQSASGKSVNISFDALQVAAQTLGAENEKFQTSFTDEYGNMKKTLGDHVVPECSNRNIVGEKLNSGPADISNKCSFTKVEDGGSMTDYCGFSSALGEKVEVIETTLQHTKNNSGDPKDLDEKEFFGFSTTSWKKVEVSEKALKQAKNTSADSKDLNEKFEFCGFSTASGKDVSISQKALKAARTVLESSPVKKSTSSTDLYGFSTVSKVKVQLSDKAHEYTQPSPSNDENTEKTKCNSHLAGVNSASGLIKEASDKTLTDLKQKLTDNVTLEGSKISSRCIGFSTASGTKVSVSERALKYARKKLADVEELTRTENEARSFDTSTNNLILEETKHVKEQSVADNITNSTDDISKITGFSAALGNKVSVSEGAFKHVKEAFADSDKISDKVENMPKFMGFSTASGTKVQVSEKALNYAKEKLTDNISDKTETIRKHGSLSTATGNKVQLSEKALKHVKRHLLETINLNQNPESETMFIGFSTASGNRVEVSEQALKHAKSHLSETDILNQNPQSEIKFAGFSTASGNRVEVSEQALKHAKNQLSETDHLNENPQSESKFTGFSTASGNRVDVSKQALKHAKSHLSESDNWNQSPQPEIKFTGFSTASGNRVDVSKQALKHAKSHLSESDNWNQSPKSETKFPGFSTASGNRVEVSEQALKHAKSHLTETVTFKQNPESKTKFPGFSTASGNGVQVSEQALKHAKSHLLETGNLIQNPQPETKFTGFSTASGNKVEVSKKALQHAKSHLTETDTLNHNPECTGFSTTSGTTLEVSESAFELATDTLNMDFKDDNSINQSDGHYISEFTERNLDQIENKKAHLENPEAEIGAADLEEMFGMALKRRKLDMNRERKIMQNLPDEESLCKRKAVKTASKGMTDQRHPGFRPFKPVFCKSVDRKQERQDNDKHSGAATRSASDVKSSFKIPYKTTPDTSSVSSDSISSSKKEMTTQAPVLISKSMIATNQGDRGDRMTDMTCDMAHMSPSGDYRQKSFPGVNKSLEIQNTSTKSDFLGEPEVQTDSRSTEKERCKFKQESLVENCNNQKHLESDVIELYENSASKKAVTKEVEKSDVLEPRAQVSEQNEFDSFSQDEDDVYYCTLVEARRQQDDIVKKRAADRVRPVAGRLWKMKQAQNRWKLKDVVDNFSQAPHRSDVHVTSETAVDHKFVMDSHYDRNTAHVFVGDGAYLVPDDAGKAGKHEFYRAFLTIEGIDASLTSETWVYNHYRWIVWKLAAYEKKSTYLSSKCLTPEMVMLQLKYRYDREVDLSQRSALKKIYERDDTPSKRLVLCVAAVKHTHPAGCAEDQSKPGLDEKVLLEMTDGWYSIPAQIDPPLTHLVLKGKITVGQKLCVTGAELVGGEDACTPLEAPSSITLRISRNSTRPAPWDSILGYQADPRPLCVPLSDLHSEGGIVGVADVVIVRKYPTLYMEKFEGGGCIFRTSRCEDRARQEYDTRKQSEMEKLYRQMENKVEKEQKQERKATQHKKYSRTDIESLQSGQEIYEAMEEAAQPDMVQNYLSEQQLGMLYEYQRQIQEQKQFELNSKFQRAWQEKLEVFPERVVTPVLKFRVAGCANRDLDQHASTVLTVWRPAPEICDIQEGHRYKLYSLSASVSRSKYTAHTVQLTATKQTRFRRMQLDENILDSIYEPREVLWVSDIKRRQPPYGELDFVGVIVKITQSPSGERTCDTVYLADCQTGILAIRFWNGYKSFGEDLFLVGSVLCCSNLMDKSSYRSFQIPTVEVSPEFTHITNRSQNTAHRKALDKLLTVSKDKKTFIENANTAIDQLQNENMNSNIPTRIQGITDDFIKAFPRRNVDRQSLNTCQAASEHHNVTPEVNDDIPEHQHHRNDQEHESTSCNTSETSNTERQNEISVSAEHKIPVTDSNLSTPDRTVVSTPMIERKRAIAQARMSRLMSYGSPSVLSPLNTTVPRSVSKGFKPPAFKTL